LIGYELLFRDSLENCFVGNADEASRATLDRSLVMGLDVLWDGRRAFVNCTRDTLIKGLVGLLPSTATVVEILETVPSDPDVTAACHSLKEQGYMIALDDYVADDAREHRWPRWPTSSRSTCNSRPRSNAVSWSSSSGRGVAGC
jgi:c-di-GMP-related signal transduction protein